MRVDTGTIDWLLSGDPAVEYQVRRDLLGESRPAVQRRIATEGWGARFLTARNEDGSWGNGFYEPKWTSSHYTLLDLRLLELPRDNERARESAWKIAREYKGDDGGVNPPGTIKQSDVCINGMYLSYGCYFGVPQTDLASIVDFVISQHMDDGGFNCRRNRSGARHSSVHSTLSVLEGIAQYQEDGYTYRSGDLEQCAAAGRDFLLRHRLFKSDRTGKVIHPELLVFAFPPRWKYNVLRALDYFRRVAVPRDARMADALAVVTKKRRSDGRWPMQRAQAGSVHFVMEEARSPSRWNTLIALRVLDHWSVSGPATPVVDSVPP